MGKSGNPARSWKSTGIHVDVSKTYGKEPRDPGPGRHLWSVVAMWTVNPKGEEFHLDKENLVSIQGPGCYKCEQPFTDELAARLCQGSMK